MKDTIVNRKKQFRYGLMEWDTGASAIELTNCISERFRSRSVEFLRKIIEITWIALRTKVANARFLFKWAFSQAQPDVDPVRALFIGDHYRHHTQVEDSKVEPFVLINCSPEERVTLKFSGSGHISSRYSRCAMLGYFEVHAGSVEVWEIPVLSFRNCL